jgi:hypothetical protein
MMKAYTAANDEAKKTLEKDLLGRSASTNKKNNDKYKDQVVLGGEAANGKAPMSDEDFKKKLEETKYTPDATANMMKKYTGATDEEKKLLEKELLGHSEATNEKTNDKYKDQVKPGGDPTQPKAPLSDEDFRQQLVETKYSPEAIAEMMKEYTGATDDAKHVLHTDLVKRSEATVAKNEAKYKAKAKAAAGGPGTNPPGATTPLSEDEFKKELKKRKKYSDPAIDNMMKEYKAAATDDVKKALADKLLVSDSGKQTANNEEYKSKVVPDGQPTNPAGSKPPKSDEEFKASLVARGYTVPALGKMMDAYKAATTDEAKKALSDKLLVTDKAQRTANQKEYSKTEPSTDGETTREKLDAALKARGFDDESTRKRMVDIWDKITDPKEKKGFEKKFLDPANTARYKSNYSDTGLYVLPEGEIAKLSQNLKGLGYDDKTRRKMREAWQKATTNVDREKIYNQITSTDPAVIAKNKIDYGPGGTGPPPPESVASAGKLFIE